jgi:hypothetical protein
MSKKISKILFVSLVVLFISIVVGCASDLSEAEKPGALLWGENCGRCHNVRPPSSLTDSEWDVAVMHMRVRANLTEVEAEKIAAFLKAGN